MFCNLWTTRAAGRALTLNLALRPSVDREGEGVIVEVEEGEGEEEAAVMEVVEVTVEGAVEDRAPGTVLGRTRTRRGKPITTAGGAMTRRWLEGVQLSVVLHDY